MSAPQPTAFSQNTLTVRELGCERGMRMLFESLSFSLHSGQALQITGANGIGKTSLLRILATLSIAESGQLEWNGADVRQAAAGYRSAIAFLGHKNALKADLSPMQNLTSLCGLQPFPGNAGEISARIKAALESTGISGESGRPIRQLSAGQRQRVALARVSLGNNPLWLLDEPATALDQEGIARLEALIQQHLERGGLMVFTSHQTLEIQSSRLSTRVLGQ